MPPRSPKKAGNPKGFFEWFWRIRFYVTVVCLVLLGGAALLYWRLGDRAPEWSRRLVTKYAPWKHPETRLIWDAWGADDIDWTEAEKGVRKALGPVPASVESGVRELQDALPSLPDVPSVDVKTPELPQLPRAQQELLLKKRDYFLKVYRARADQTQKSIDEARKKNNHSATEIAAAEKSLAKLKHGIGYLEKLPENLSALDSADPAVKRQAEAALKENPFR